MNKTSAEAKEFAVAAKPLAQLARANKIDLGVAPTYLSLQATRKYAAKSMIVAAQNCHFKESGAFTGEVSIPMLKELKINWVILGHSERRAYDNETSEKCNLKIKALLANEMTPLYCVGETLEEFEAGRTKEVVGEQVRKGLEGLSEEDGKKIVIAYEPVWSIGTGKNASTEIAQDVCHFIRKVLKECVGKSGWYVVQGIPKFYVGDEAGVESPFKFQEESDTSGITGPDVKIILREGSNLTIN